MISPAATALTLFDAAIMMYPIVNRPTDTDKAIGRDDKSASYMCALAVVERDAKIVEPWRGMAWKHQQ